MMFELDKYIYSICINDMFMFAASNPKKEEETKLDLETYDIKTDIKNVKEEIKNLEKKIKRMEQYIESIKKE